MTGQAPPEEFVTFLQYQLPGLPAGSYQLNVSVYVDDSQGNRISSQPMSRGYSFAVTGDRFALTDPAGTIAAQFPADNASGEFSSVFPHVVLAKPRLPWTRSPIQGQPKPVPGDTGAPTWLAVLLLDDGDLAQADLEPKTMKVGDLFPGKVRPGSTLGDATYSYFSRPDFTSWVTEQDPGLGYGQGYDDAVSVLDLPVGLFSAIAPTIADLELTAHVRSVSVLNKPTVTGAALDALAEPVGTYSIVVGNRLPQAAMKSHAYLVSLEGLEPFLPDDEGKPPAGVSTSANIRLAVLAHWAFFSVTGSPATFDELVLSLNDPPGDGTPGQGPAVANNTVRLVRDVPPGTIATALAEGYVPLDHSLRSGGSTVSWYRGPLATTAKAIGPPPGVPVDSPDEVMVYDPTTGMLDVSLAAAWTLGRLMALDDTTFSTALYAWKQGLRREVVTAAERRLLEQQFGPLAAVAGAANADGLPLLHHAMSLLARSEPR
jgi:hypothetical protein